MAKTEESAMRDTELYSRVLGIELPWFVSDVSVDDPGGSITVKLDVKSGSRFSCPECSRPGCSVKDFRTRTWRHLDTCQFKTLVGAPVSPNGLSRQWGEDGLSSVGT
jgi:transposase